MKHDALNMIESQLVGEGMNPQAAGKMLASLDAADADVRAAFVESFWKERKRPTVAVDVAGGSPDDHAVGEIGDEPSPTPIAWPDPDPSPDDALPLGDGTYIYLEELVLWLGEQKWSTFCLSLAKFYAERSYLTPKQTASAISTLVKTAAAKRERAPRELVEATIEAMSEPAMYSPGGGSVGRTPVTDPGVYVMEGEAYRVRWNRARTHLYAERVSMDDGLEYEYAPGIVKMLDADRKIDAMAARSIGIVTGKCVFCGRMLTTDDSVTAGYGPVCAKVHGLPHGTGVHLTRAEIDEVLVGDDPDCPPS